MFNPFKNKKTTDQKLINQVIGSQSVLFRIFQEIFEEDSEEVKKTELTYFTLSIFTYTFLRFSSLTKEEKETTVDRVTDAVLRKSIPHTEQEISIDDAISEYQYKYREYNSLIDGIFNKDRVDDKACVTLTMHIYESVMDKSAQEKMINVIAASSLVAQYIIDHIKFIKKDSC